MEIEVEIYLLIIIGILLIIGGAYLGFRAASYMIKKDIRGENIFLKEENQRLKDALSFWSSQATGNLNLYQNIIQAHNMNLSNTLGSIVGLLQSVKQDPNSNLSNDERIRIDRMIEQAKGLS
ncbi:MAG: hypothetical protein LBS20_14380 [Prevotella sp.]|jgi:predicted membrane protein|nr:hypothetical protein [Prevotella sp.]